MNRTLRTAIGTVSVAMSLGLVVVAGAAPVRLDHSVITAASHAQSTKKVTITGTYKGKVAILISGTNLVASAVTGTGSTTVLGATTISGSGQGPASATCDPLSGSGELKGAHGILKLSVVSASTTGCAAGSSAPTKVTVKGVFKVLSGTKNVAGATGTLQFSGSFTLPSTTASSSDAFGARVSGTIKVKA